MATTSPGTIGIWLFGATLTLTLALGCGRKDDPNGARPEDVVLLSKPVETPPALVADTPQASAAPVAASEERDDVIGGDAPVADDAEDAAQEDHGQGASKRKRSKSKRPASRKRASSGAAGELPEREPAPATTGAIRLKRIQFSHSIEGREPVDPEETFSASETDKLYAFLELTNDSKEKGKVIVTFVPPMGASSKVTLKVGDKSRWRTWALRKSPKAVGSWKVIVSDESGREIGHRTFEVTQ